MGWCSMKTFIVETEWAGYSRGNATYEVEANSAEEAEQEWDMWAERSRNVVRNDQEEEVTSVSIKEGE